MLELLQTVLNIKVELVKSDNTKRNIFEKLLTHLDSMAIDSSTISFHSSLGDGTGNMNLFISIDSENKITEKFKDNNFFSIPLVILPDTTVTSVSETTLSVSYDGVEMINGDYISPKPQIEMILNYPIWFPVEDTTAVQFYLNQAGDLLQPA